MDKSTDKIRHWHALKICRIVAFPAFGKRKRDNLCVPWILFYVVLLCVTITSIELNTFQSISVTLSNFFQGHGRI